MIALALILTWTAWIQQKPQNPLILTILGIPILIFFTYKTFKTRSEILRLRMARDGEKAVGQYLEALRFSGAIIFHDLPADNFNIDHLIISPHGIYLIETKTHAKPIKGKAIIQVKQNKVFANGYEIPRNPLEQATAESRWLAELIQETTGKKFPVRSVVLFPGWFVEKMSKNEDVWVLNPKALRAFIANMPETISREDLHLVSYHISRYIRQKQKSLTP
jgi:hypothetical protein